MSISGLIGNHSFTGDVNHAPQDLKPSKPVARMAIIFQPGLEKGAAGSVV
jgi:hypothetical protein